MGHGYAFQMHFRRSPSDTISTAMEPNRVRSSGLRKFWVLGVLLLWVQGGLGSWEPVAAEPLKLSDREARSVGARFEEPFDPDGDQPRRGMSRVYQASLSFDSKGHAVISVPGRVVEDLLKDSHPKAGSFSDFVWIIDPKTGEVASAHVSGILEQHAKIGFIDKAIDAKIDIQMSTRAAGGEGSVTKRFGRKIRPYCEAGSKVADCELIQPIPYDPATGKVLAVGALTASAAFVKVVTLAPLGRAEFSEGSAGAGDPESSSNAPSSPPS
ncbi:hypothetical protein MK489_18815 [Myxococcota bacterium]|nr:hypothetical protein [Myxococcota bacterium]